ncbi:MAG: CDP-diacylglycerol--serine O-phosphatidyltransferase [Azoarcus sp.]|jgi:CDP-diacylglycerol--serine O-phosphatidyltransferase|nr:CDP-diacylglycerol--serine O-phosphatidyltransferase [Azoarcus sp.]
MQSPEPRSLPAVWHSWREKTRNWIAIDKLPAIPVMAENFEVLESPEAYRRTLLALIAEARQRILIPTLYLQDDDGGREILQALYAAKAAHPELEVAVFVDWHRAQRGLIGKGRSEGNAAMYRAMAERFGPGVEICGVPVQRREIMGVMHLKGFIIDNTVLFSGASLNDVYLQRHERYRIDRYHLIRSCALADCLAVILEQTLRQSTAVHSLNTPGVPKTAEIRQEIIAFRRELARARYRFAGDRIRQGEIGVTPLFGLGIRDNGLNRTIVELIRQAKNQLVLFTPYFNPPGPVQRALDARLKGGCRVMIVLGDKTANDFYIPPDEAFKAIGAVPYLYETNLRRFCKARQRFIDSGQLDVRLWRNEDNTYHLKGLLVDDDYTLLTGNNINPRAWRLDLENGLLIHDPNKLLSGLHRAELERVLAHTRRLANHADLDPFDAYPEPVQRLIKRLARVRADRLVNQVL